MDRTCHLSEQQHPVVESGWSRCCPRPLPRPLLLLDDDNDDDHDDDNDSDADDDDDEERPGHCPLLLLTASSTPNITRVCLLGMSSPSG